jgi:hypothetical protein
MLFVAEKRQAAQPTNATLQLFFKTEIPLKCYLKIFTAIYGVI